MSPGSFRVLLQRFLHVSGTDLSDLSAPGSSSCPYASASATRILSSTLLDPSLEQDTKWDCGFSKVKRLVAQSCPTLCNLMDCSPPDSSVHGILQARIQEWVAISFSRGSSWPKDQTHVSYTADRFFTIWATREAHVFSKPLANSASSQHKSTNECVAIGSIYCPQPSPDNANLEVFPGCFYQEINFKI